MAQSLIRLPILTADEALTLATELITFAKTGSCCATLRMTISLRLGTARMKCS